MKYFPSLLLAAVLSLGLSQAQENPEAGAPAGQPPLGEPPTSETENPPANLVPPARVFTPSKPGEPGPDHSVLRVTVTGQGYHPQLPWQKLNPGSRRGLGALLPGQKILVTAQLAADATYLELEKPDSGRKITAKVTGIDYEANLALLEPVEKDDDFFKDMVPLELDDTARIGDKNLEVWQMEDDGNPIVTSILFKEVDIAGYFLGSYPGLVFEGFGLLGNVGSSFTLPVVKNGRLVGMLIRYNSGEQVSTILPSPTIRHFLDDLADGTYDGFPSLGIGYESTIDEQLRKFKGLKDEEEGVYITRVAYKSVAEKMGVTQGDILMEINGFPIDSRGNYEDPDFGTLNLAHLTRGRGFVGDEISLLLWRDGKREEIKGKLERPDPKEQMVEPYRFDAGTPYLIHGGMIFLELSMNYLASFGAEWKTSAPLILPMSRHTLNFTKKTGNDWFSSAVSFPATAPKAMKDSTHSSSMKSTASPLAA
jgi:S1-C subfamily serine protease